MHALRPYDGPANRRRVDAPLDADLILKLLVVFVPMLLSLSVHEFSHAWSAHLLGDDTAARRGRLTVNPLAHIDLFGTVLLPLLLVLTDAGFFFGWAKPVPVNPTNFTRRFTMRQGMMLTAAAGPASNVVMAVLSVALLKLLFVLQIQIEALYLLLFYMLSINLILALFNLIPFPPLDGSKVLMGLLPDRFSGAFDFLQQNPWLYLVGFFVLIRFAGVIIGPPYTALLRGLLGLFGVPIPV